MKTLRIISGPSTTGLFGGTRQVHYLIDLDTVVWKRVPHHIKIAAGIPERWWQKQARPSSVVWSRLVDEQIDADWFTGKGVVTTVSTRQLNPMEIKLAVSGRGEKIKPDVATAQDLGKVVY